MYADADADLFDTATATPDCVTFQLGIKTRDEARDFFAHVVKSLKSNGIPIVGVNEVGGEDLYIFRAWLSPTRVVVLSSKDAHDWKLQLVNNPAR